MYVLANYTLPTYQKKKKVTEREGICVLGGLLRRWDGSKKPSIPFGEFRTVSSISQAVSLGMIVTSARIIWKESPVVVVLSGSMEPGFKKGDILFLHMSKDLIRAGEIVVFNVGSPPSVLSLSSNINCFSGPQNSYLHRVVKVHERQDIGEVDVLTKGDNNYEGDRLLYAEGQLWLQRQHIMGRAVGFLPYVGWVTIIMTKKPIIKYILIGALGLLVITSKD